MSLVSRPMKLDEADCVPIGEMSQMMPAPPTSTNNQRPFYYHWPCFFIGVHSLKPSLATSPTGKAIDNTKRDKALKNGQFRHVFPDVDIYTCRGVKCSRWRSMRLYGHLSIEKCQYFVPKTMILAIVTIQNPSGTKVLYIRNHEEGVILNIPVAPCRGASGTARCFNCH